MLLLLPPLPLLLLSFKLFRVEREGSRVAVGATVLLSVGVNDIFFAKETPSALSESDSFLYKYKKQT